MQSGPDAPEHVSVNSATIMRSTNALTFPGTHWECYANELVACQPQDSTVKPYSLHLAPFSFSASILSIAIRPYVAYACATSNGDSSPSVGLPPLLRQADPTKIVLRVQTYANVRNEIAAHLDTPTFTQGDL